MISRQTISVGDLFDLENGFAFKSKDFIDEGVPVIKIKNVKAGFFSEHEFSYVSDKFLSERANKLAKSHDLLISMSGNRHDGSPETWVGKVAYFDRKTPYFLNQRVGALRLKDGKQADVRFLGYLLSSFPYQEQFIAIATSSGGQANLSPAQILGAEIVVPPIEEQREIAAILGLLDDKIELNRKTAATLEEMARALYRSWFVDFDPVHAKAAGRAPAHMPPQTAALFPDCFGEDGLPEGWELGALSDLIDFNPREKLPKGTLAPYLDMKALPTVGMSSEPPYDRAFTSGTKFRARDTLLARITPCLENGKTAMVDSLGEAEIGWGSTEFIVMRAKDGVPSSLPYCVARDASFREEAIASMTGSSGRQRADAKTIAAIETAVPPEEIIVAFGQATMPMIEKTHQLGSENQTLATLRDTLLPRLMSGELRVGEAKKELEVSI